MRKSDQLAAMVAKIDERNEQFDVLEQECEVNNEGHLVYPLSAIAELMNYDASDTKFDRAVNQAKIAIRKSTKKIGDHFIPGNLFNRDNEVCVTVYAAFLIIVNGSPESDFVAQSQDYFASKANIEVVEEEKRLRNRFDVLEENKKLASTAKSAGVSDHRVFIANGYQGMYGGRNIGQVASMKGLKKGSDVLDFAGSEELAAHLFRITQTNAALTRENVKSETGACATHKRVGKAVRTAIRDIGGTMPEDLPPSEHRMDVLITKTKRRLNSARDT